MDLNAGQIKKLLKNWHFYKASISTAGDGKLKDAVEAIERFVNSLNDVDKRIVTARFFDRAEVDIVAKMVHMSRRAVYYRIEGIVNEMVFCLDFVL